MKKMPDVAVLLLALSLSWAVCADNGKAVKPIELTTPEAIQDATELNTAIDAVSDKVMECAKTAEKPEDCHCRFPEETGRLEKIYASVISKHPDWQDEVIFWQRADGYSYNLAVDGVRRSLALPCPSHSAK